LFEIVKPACGEQRSEAIGPCALVILISEPSTARQMLCSALTKTGVSTCHGYTTRSDVEHLRERLRAHIEVLDDWPTLQGDLQLAVAVFTAALAIGFPVSSVTVEIEDRG
jgi:hypothetical protein